MILPMAFWTSLRIASDSAQPVRRRVANLVGAVEKFSLMSFYGTLLQLHVATGSRPDDWSPEQLDRAALLLGDARRDWMVHRSAVESAAHQAKSAPGYVRVDIPGVFAAWWGGYFTPARLAEWGIDSLPNVGFELGPDVPAWWAARRDPTARRDPVARGWRLKGED